MLSNPMHLQVHKKICLQYTNEPNILDSSTTYWTEPRNSDLHLTIADWKH